VRAAAGVLNAASRAWDESLSPREPRDKVVDLLCMFLGGEAGPSLSGLDSSLVPAQIVFFFFITLKPRVV